MKTNNLIHKIDINNDSVNAVIKIRLNDECNNGHQDFSITGTFYEAGKSRTDRNMIAGGCCHDDIVKVMPDLQQFVDLHLCDFSGNPMYTLENGFYHLKEDATVAQSYLRATDKEMKSITMAEDKNHLFIIMMELGMFDRYQEEANEAIVKLETLTGNEFVNDSKRSQLKKPSEDEIKLTKQRLKDGCYTPEKLAERAEEKKQAENAKRIEEIEEECANTIEKAKNKKDVFLILNETGISLNNIIYYDHSKTVGFDVFDHRDKIGVSKFNDIIDNIDRDKLPKGLAFELKGVRKVEF